MCDCPSVGDCPTGSVGPRAHCDGFAAPVVGVLALVRVMLNLCGFSFLAIKKNFSAYCFYCGLEWRKGF